MICQLCNKPVGSHWTSHPTIGAICSECSDKPQDVVSSAEKHGVLPDQTQHIVLYGSSWEWIV